MTSDPCKTKRQGAMTVLPEKGVFVANQGPEPKVATKKQSMGC